MIDGYPVQGIDQWNGQRNETAAGLHFEPLTFHGSASADPLRPPFDPWLCRQPQ